VRSPRRLIADLPATAPSCAADAEVYFGHGLSPTLFAAAPSLRWVHTAAAGVTSLLFPAMRDSDVKLTNSAGVTGDTIAEHVLGGVIYLLRSFDIAVRNHDRRYWDKLGFGPKDTTIRELSECRALIVGTGGIGGAVGWRLSVLGVHCVGVRRRPQL